MKTANAKLSSKSQLVLPKLVRDRLGLKTGDMVRFVDGPTGIMIERAPAHEGEDPFAAFSEWSSDADEQAYGDL